MRRLTVIILLIFAVACLQAQSNRQTENVVLITLDGLRWQELFTGADSLLIAHPDYVADSVALKEAFWQSNAQQRRVALMPFFWEVIAQQGMLYGNRAAGSRVNLTNPHWFSYPGYHEILTGFSDARINSNDKVPNPNQTVLEVIHQQPAFQGKVAAFGSWDVFPYIINEQRSGIPVNAGYEPASDDGSLTAMEQAINKLQAAVPGHWPTVRMDAFTHYYALEHMKKRHPRVTYIAYGETDDFAHEGNYQAYLYSARQTDAFIRELWDWIQSNNHYRDKTTLIITTDHGRGTQPLDSWRSHGSEVPGADQTWLAILGPDTPAMQQESLQGQFYASQIAPTVAALLGVAYQPPKPAGEVLTQAIQGNNRHTTTSKSK